MQKIIIIVTFILYSMGVLSQQVKGVIVNQNNKPIELVEVLVVNRDSITIKNDFTNAIGSFVLTIERGDYILQVRQEGKIIYKQKLTIINDIDLGIIPVIENKHQLEEVSVTSKKKLIERKVDRLVFNVENSIAATGGDALDVLKVTPGLRVQNESINMIGKSGMKVMIDDRMILLSGDDLINYLKTIPSDNIKNIEVITAPPSKYDADGNSGMVNIQLKKVKKNTISGNFKTSYTQAKYPSESLGGGLNYQKNKLTISSNLNLVNGIVAPYQEYTISYPKYTWFEENKTKNNQKSLSGKVNLEYLLSKKTAMGIQYSGVFNNLKRDRTNTSYITNSKTTLLDSLIITPSIVATERKTHSLNFYSITKLDTLGKQFSINVDFLDYTSDLNNNFSTSSYLVTNLNQVNGFESAYSFSDQNIAIYSAKVDFELPLKLVKLSFGGKISFINNHNKVSFFDTTNATFVFDPTKSNVFSYKENTQAVYILANKKLSEKLDLQLGLRLEITQTEGFSYTLNQTNANNYDKLFPTAYLTYKVSENNTLGLNYSRRIDRPSYSRINPFRFYSSSFNYSEGNPFLQPYFTDNLELSHTYKNLNTSVYSSYLKNGIDQITFVSDQSAIQIVKPFNFYTQKIIGIAENYTFNKWEFWTSNLLFTIFYSKTSSEIPNTVPDIDGWANSLNSNNNFNLNKNKSIKAEINFTYQSPSISGSYKSSALNYFDIGFKFLFLQKKLQASINCIDVFRTNKTTFVQLVNGIKQQNFDYADNQRIRLSIVWNFGKSIKENKRETSNSAEQSRIN
jgi:outer membrane receptor protein involved in Fe transport